MSCSLAATGPQTAAGAAWIVDVEGDATGSPAERVARDFELFEALAADSISNTVRIWQAERCIVVPRQDARLATFQTAAAASDAAGWPVVVRETGGTAFPIGPETLQVSIVLQFAPGTVPSAQAVYRQLCAPVITALLERGVHATLGATPGSMCDGAYNLCIDDRKLAGTAQRQRRLPNGRTVVLAHAAVSVGGYTRSIVTAVETYYAALGRPQHFADGRHTCLMECLAGRDTRTLEWWGAWAASWLGSAYERHRR